MSEAANGAVSSAPRRRSRKTSTPAATVQITANATARIGLQLTISITRATPPNRVNSRAVLV